MYDAPSEHKNATACATSSSLPARASGTAPSMACFCSSVSTPVIAVSIKPGETALTVMEREASSRASERVKPSSAALLDA
jgi:hypothetical protein